MSKDKKNWVIPGFKVMEWLRATRDELSLQYLAMTPEERRKNFSKERWGHSARGLLNSSKNKQSAIASL